MIIAQSALNIDENAMLAQNAMNKANALAESQIEQSFKDRQHYESLLSGKVTTSPQTPWQANDQNQHSDGDLWIETDQNGNGINMYNYSGGGWALHKWDQASLNVNQLSALSANLGTVTSGILNSVALNSAEINVDIDGSGQSHDYGHDATTWSTRSMYQNDNGNNWTDNDYMGFHFKHGLMSWKAFKEGTGLPGTSTYTDMSGSNLVDTTYIGPADIKIRTTKGTESGSVDSRVDIRSSYIQVGDSFNDPIMGDKGSVGCGFYSDGTAIITTSLYCNDFDSGFSGSKEDKGTYIHFHDTITTTHDIYARWSKNKGTYVASDLSIKNVRDDFDSKKALSEVLGTDIYSYHYKDDNDQTNIGPVIDDIHDVTDAHYNTSEYMVQRGKDGNSFALQNTIGLLIGSVHELSNQNEQLLGKITKLEAQVNGNH